MWPRTAPQADRTLNPRQRGATCAGWWGQVEAVLSTAGRLLDDALTLQRAFDLAATRLQNGGI